MSVSKLDMRCAETHLCNFMGTNNVRCTYSHLKCIDRENNYQYVCVCHGKQSAQTQIVDKKGE